jgi:hypothetical protein
MQIIAPIVSKGRFRVLYALPLLLFALTFSAHGQAVTTPPLNTLYNFPGGSGGAYPEGSVILGANNALFGTTYSGGVGWGTVYELTPPAMPGGTWTPTTIYTFIGAGGDGANPEGTLVIGASNIMYGTTVNGGAYGLGSVYQLVPPTTQGGPWTESVIYSFTGGADGQNPSAGLIVNASANLYGTTAYGGTGNCGGGCGTVFQLKPNGTGGWTENVVYNFQNGTDGAEPLTELYSDKNGVLYGTTYSGGTPASGSPGSGTVFQLIPGQPWKETVIYTFTGLTDGAGPWARLTAGPGGVLFGSTFWGGKAGGCKLGGYAAGCGTVFELAPPASAGNPWQFIVLYSFTGIGYDGSHPFGPMAYSGSLYGSTYSGGSTVNTCFPAAYYGCGTIFQIKGNGTTWKKRNLHAFNESDGGGPNGVIHLTTGNIYGTTFLGGITPGVGTIFQIQ